MKTVRVIYTTTADYAATNQQNIAAIVAELKALNHPGFKYGAWLLTDGKSFMHFDQFATEEALVVLQQLGSVILFAVELDANGFEAEPVLELLTLVAATEAYY